MKVCAKRLIALLLCLSIVGGVLPAVSAVGTGASAVVDNTLEVQNPGFEEKEGSGVPGWYEYYASGENNDFDGTVFPGCTFGRSTERYHSGEASLKITDDSTSKTMSIYSSGTLNVHEGYTYRVSAWMYSESGDLPRLSVKFFNMYSMEVANSAQYTTMETAGQWTRVTVEAVAPMGAVMLRAMPTSLKASTAVFYVDDVTVEQLSLLGGWEEVNGVSTSAPVKAFAETEYVLTGFGESDAVTVSFLTSGALITKYEKASGDSATSLRLVAPANTDALQVQTSGSTDAMVLAPAAVGTQVPDGSFESMGQYGTSAWSGIYASGETVAVPGGDFEIDLENNQVTMTTDWWASHNGTTVAVTGSLPGERTGNALEVTLANPKASGGGARSPEIEVQPGGQYTVDLDYYVPSGAKADIYIEFWSSAPTRAPGNADGRVSFEKIACTGGAWTDFSKVVTAPNNAKYITVLLYFNKDTAATSARTGYVDNAVISRPAALPVDGTFEEAVNDPAPWTVSHNNGCINYTNQLAHSGSMSMKFTSVVNANGTGARSPLMEATPGTEYTFSAYYRADHATKWYVEFWNAAGTRLKADILDMAAAADWTAVTATSTAPENTVAISVLGYFPKVSSAALHTMFIDDVSVCAAGGENLLANPGFEDHNTWRVNNFDNVLYFTDEKAATGTMSMKYEAFSVGGGARTPLLPITAGSTYTVNTKYLSPDGNSNLYIEYWKENDFDRNASKRCATAHVPLAATADWKDISVSLAAPADAQYMTVLLNTPASKKTSVLYLDDLAIECTDNIYANSFDSGAAVDTDFKGWKSNKGYISAQKTAEQKSEGVSSVYISSSQASDGFRSPMVEVKPGDAYTAYADYITANDNLNIYLEYWSDASTRVLESHHAVEPSDTWAQAVSDTMIVPEGAKYATVLLYFTVSDGTSFAAYLDDVYLVKNSTQVTYDTMVSQELVTDGAYGLALPAGSNRVSGYIPAMSGKEYAAVADVKGDASLTLTYYDVNGAALSTHSASTDGTAQQKLVLTAQAPNYTFGARITLHADGESVAYFDNVQIHAVADGLSNASFEDVTARGAGKFATQWQSFGDVRVNVYGAVTLPDGALATQLTSLGGEGGIRSSMIRVTPGSGYTVRAAAVAGSANARIAFYDSSFNRLGTGTVAPASAAYAAVEFTVTDGNSAVIDDVEFAPAVIDVSDNAQLFIDDYIIANTDLGRVFYQAEKTEPIEEFNPIKDGSAPWQGGGSYLYGSVLYDEKEELYKMWYQTYCGADATGSDAVQVMANYATSEDGINWTMPNLGPHDRFYPTQDSNILGNYHIQSVFLEYDAEGNPHYTMITYLHDTAYRTMVSTDGIHWTKDQTFMSGSGVYDVVTAAHDEENDRYISVVKSYRLGSSHRDQWTMFEVADGQWSKAYMSNTLADLIDAQRCYRPESYGQGLYERDGVYIGFNWSFYTPGPGQRGSWNVGPIEPQLTFSRDLTEEWQRPTRLPIIPMGEEGSVDDGMIFTASYAIEVGDEVWLYCGSWDGDHGNSKRDAYIYIAKWRMDGFASMSGTGSLTTKPMTFDGNALLLNADASGGTVTVELLDENGQSIFGKSDPITGDSVEHLVSWKGESGLSNVSGPVTVKINATNADIYSFSFAQKDVADIGSTPSVPEISVDKTTASNGDVLTYTITYTNDSAAAADVTITDTLSNEVDYVEGSAADATYADGVLTWNFTDVPSGETVVVSFQVKVNSDTAASVSNTADVVVNGVKVTTGSVETAVSSPVVSSPTVEALKEQSVGSGSFTKELVNVEGGEIVTYRITVSNTGDGDAYGITVSDVIPAGLTLVNGSITADGTLVGATVVWEIQTLAAGESVQLSFQVKVPAVKEITVWENIASVTCENQDPDDAVGETNKVEIKQTPTVTPDTGDNSPLLLLTVLMATSAAALVLLMISNKRRKQA